MTDFEKMYDGSWYTITGVGGDETEWKNGYQDMLTKAGIGTIREWVAFTGDEMNRYYGLTDNNAYPCDRHFLAFPLDGLCIKNWQCSNCKCRTDGLTISWLTMRFVKGK